jgi:hypothetical protein
VVDREADDGYETLDLDDPVDADPRHIGSVLPPLTLGDAAGEPPETAPADGRSATPSRRRWVALGVAFIVGVAAGAYLWQMRHEAAEDAAAAARAADAELVAGTVVGGLSPGTAVQHLAVLLLNNGPREIEVLAIHPPGWEAFPREPTTIPADEWATVPMSVAPQCGAPPPIALSVEVRTAEGEQELAVPLPPSGSVLDSVYQQMCADGDGPRYAVTTGRIAQLAPTEPDSMVMRVELRSLPPGVAFEVVEATASSGGAIATATNLPVEFSVTRRTPSPIELTWQMVTCDLTSLLGDVNLELTIATPDGDSYQTFAALPGQAVAMLARFTVEQCPS